MPIKIVNDSNCDLHADLVARYSVTVVPLYINIGKKSYLRDHLNSHRQRPECDGGCSAPGSRRDEKRAGHRI